MELMFVSCNPTNSLGQTMSRTTLPPSTPSTPKVTSLNYFGLWFEALLRFLYHWFWSWVLIGYAKAQTVVVSGILFVNLDDFTKLILTNVTNLWSRDFSCSTETKRRNMFFVLSSRSAWYLVLFLRVLWWYSLRHVTVNFGIRNNVTVNIFAYVWINWKIIC